MSLAEGAISSDIAARWVAPVHHPRCTVVLALSEEMHLRADSTAPLLVLLDRGAELLLVHARREVDIPRQLQVRRGVRVVVAPPGTSLKDLRALGMRQAGGDIVVMLDDEDLADGAWQRAARFVQRDADGHPLAAAL